MVPEHGPRVRLIDGLLASNSRSGEKQLRRGRERTQASVRSRRQGAWALEVKENEGLERTCSQVSAQQWPSVRVDSQAELQKGHEIPLGESALGAPLRTRVHVVQIEL